MERIGYFNAFLFPLAVAGRLAKRLRGDTTADDRLPPGPVNAVLQAIFSAERHLIGRLPFPGGSRSTRWCGPPAEATFAADALDEIRRIEDEIVARGRPDETIVLFRVTGPTR